MVAGTIGLLALFVWWIRPVGSDFKPAPLDPVSEECRKVDRPFVPSNATEMTDPPLEGFTGEERLRIFRKLNFMPCTCGCNQSVAECRANNVQCEISREMATRVLEETRAARK